MISSENPTDETASVSLTITNLDLPDADERGKALVTTLEERLATLLASEFNQPTAEVDGRIGHWYASVSPCCPDCGNALDIQDVHLGSDGDAFAVARCTDDCGWTGDAVFTLTDVDEDVDGNPESSVLAGRMTPEYQPYCDRNP